METCMQELETMHGARRRLPGMERRSGVAEQHNGTREPATSRADCLGGADTGRNSGGQAGRPREGISVLCGARPEVEPAGAGSRWLARAADYVRSITACVHIESG